MASSNTNLLLPGLSDEVALLCLVRIPYQRLPASRHVSSGWKREIEAPEFRNLRKSSGSTQPVIVVAQDWHPSPTGDLYSSSPPFYKLAFFDPETGEWYDLPWNPDLPEDSELPVHCHLVSVGSDLIVMGGYDNDEMRLSNSVFIYNFIRGRWRRGAPIPGHLRRNSACASDSERMVYIAGGQDERRDSLKSAMVYDVAEDNWTQLPDMTIGRDDCSGMFQGGKFYVIGQSSLGRDAVAFDVAMSQWCSVDNELFKDDAQFSTNINGHDGKMYMCKNRNVMEYNGTSWRIVGELPDEVRYVDYVTGWQGKMLVIGFETYFGPHRVFLMDLKTD